jgi:uncharacterized protein YceH (UPF0502 family)
MVEFDGLDEVATELAFLASREEPLALDIGRRPGQKEERWASPLVGPSWSGTAVADTEGQASRERGVNDSPADDEHPLPGDSLRALRSDVSALESEVSDLRRQLSDLRASLGD